MSQSRVPDEEALNEAAHSTCDNASQTQDRWEGSRQDSASGITSALYGSDGSIGEVFPRNDRGPVFLKVVDFDCLAKTWISQTQLHLNDKMDEVLAAIPDLGSNTVRIYDYVDGQAHGSIYREKQKEGEILNHIARKYQEPNITAPSPGKVHSSRSYLPHLLWSEHLAENEELPWVSSEHILLDGSDKLSTPKAWTRFLTGASTTSTFNYMTFLSLTSDTIVVIHKSARRPRGSSTRSYFFSNFLQKDNLLLRDNDNHPEQASLLLLSFWKSCLVDLTTTVQQLLGPDSLWREWNASTPREALKRHRMHAPIYDRLLEIAQDLRDEIQFASSGIEVDPASGLGYCISQMRYQCTRQIKSSKKIIDRSEKRYKQCLDLLSASESVSLKRLTVLAAFFLPLSLGTGILSMQTRFADLHFLLYDFLGVAIILASIAILINLLLKLWFKFMSLDIFRRIRSGIDINTENHPLINQDVLTVYHTFQWLGYSFFISFGVVLLVSFVIGMCIDVQLGGKALGYGAAGIFGIGAILFIFGLWWFSHMAWSILLATFGFKRRRA